MLRWIAAAAIGFLGYRALTSVLSFVFTVLLGGDVTRTTAPIWTGLIYFTLFSGPVMSIVLATAVAPSRRRVVSWIFTAFWGIQTVYSVNTFARIDPYFIANLTWLAGVVVGHIWSRRWWPRSSDKIAVAPAPTANA